MNKFKAIILFILFTSSFLFSQTNYYVAKNGSNSNSGTSLSTPFLTISHAISQINAGDRIYIRRGTYHEAIIIDNIDSTLGNETLISNYNNEEVVIDGTISIDGSWTDDTIGGVAVKKNIGITQSISQLFVGNNQMVMARWPNAQFSDLSIYDHDNWAHGEETGSTDGSFLIDETYENPGSLSLANSIGILNVGSFRTFNREIASHTQQAGDDVITYTTPIGENGLGAGLSNNGQLKDKHHHFFFEGKKEFIDAENEWFLDATNDILYLKPPNGLDLFQTPVRGKIRDYSLTISGSEHLKINGLTFFATTIHASGTKYLEISECNFYYPSHSKRMLGDLSGANATTFGTGSGNIARVDSSTVSGCLFINTEGEALVIRGNNNTVKNSYFRNIDWSATEINGLMVSVFIDGTQNTFTGNEIYYTGASATVWPGEQSIFSYNIVSSTGHAQSDGSVFQGTKNYVFGSEVHHNFVYDTEKYAFRYDAPGGDAAQAGSFGVMHHNIADNTLGLMIKGNNQIIAHNTVLNTINNRNDIIILAEGCSNTNTWLYNNLAERIGSHRSDILFSAPSNGPIPIGTEGYIKNGNNWEACDSNDGSLYSGSGTGSSTANIDSINQSRPGIVYNANIESLINYNPGNGKTISDYQPISNVIIDQGISLTNTVSTSLTQSDQLNSIVPHIPIGSGTDIGAIDGNSLWTPGVQGWTPQQNINLEDIFYDPGIVESNLLLHFDFANSTSYPGSGNKVYDLSDNYNQGDLNGNPSMLSNNGGVIDLDGSDDYIQLNDPFSYQQHTIEMWIKMRETGSAFLWDARDSNDDGYILWNNNARYSFFINTNDNNNNQSYQNQWVQVVANYNGDKSRIFINGQQVNLSNSITNNNINNNTNARIGGRSFDPVVRLAEAEIGIVRFYDKTLSSVEVIQNYNANATRFGLSSNSSSPTSIEISSPTFSETISASSTIATLSAVDSDTSDNYVFTLIAGDGSNDVDNSSFTVSGTSLIINSTANYETKSSYSIYINVNDGENNFAKAFTLSVIDRLDPIITFDDLTKVYGDTNFNLTSNSSSTGAYIYNISNTNVATVTGNNVTIKGAGITTVTVIQAEDSNYNAATSSMTLTVNKAYPSINFDDLIKVFGDANFNLATTSSSTGAYDYNISNTDLASVTGNTVTIIGAGTTIVTVTQAEDSNYSSATASMSLTINKADPGIGNFNNINKIYGDSDFEIIDPSKNNLNNSNFVYSSSDSNIASISGKTISINRVGSVIISANLPADSNFNAAVVSTTLNINKSSQTISVASLPTTLPLKDFNTISLTASSTSGTPVSINLANGSAATLNGVPGNYNLQSIQQTGLVTITFYVDENSSVNYSAASVVLVVDVVKVNQNIYFNSLPNNYFNYNENLSIPIEASASSSLPLSYNLISGNASLNSNIITVTGTGQISVELTQIGDSQFNAAPPLNYTLNIGQGTTVLSGFNIPSKYKDDSPFQITPPISNRVGQIVYSSSNLQVATISGDQVTILNNGQTIIKAEQITNNNYKSGTVSAVFIVNDNTIIDGDNDGISDENDNCISNFNPLQNDYDNDGIGNICDDDDDNDGYNDSNDEFPLNPNEWDDYDKDGFGDNEDEDDDNDSWSDNIEISCNTDPLNNSSFPNDYDGDLIPNCNDQDDDNDGYPDDQDDFPENEFEWVDTDKDGIGDNEDEDDDGDEYNDNDEIKCDSDPLDSNSKPSDLDKDLVPNCFDLDDDNDGCLDDDDAFPLDNSECLDNDNDGIGDNSDNDDDNDGVYDLQDAFPFDSAEQKDTDGDGIGDNSDSDYNSDGLPDNVLLPSQFFSPNGDGINDTWNVINTNLFPNCEVWIYTRSGELIYNKKGYANDWTGLLNGQPIPEASYVYMVDQNGDGIIDLKGWFYLTR